ncbi:unnamed protein product [Phytophthora fragariaefolia]|uniref:Unnamed protein product n=1 Tax=Phytophthora fragariaefolia TaxID=1490495 RepID=A0A9W6WWG2_9STRA|nr:unnamed protein product [Phytophthora fragariaefolia]
MRVLSVLAVAPLACSGDFAVSEEVKLNSIVDSGDTYTLHPKSVRGVRQRLLRSVDEDNLEHKDAEERVYGTEIVRIVHNLSPIDAKMVRQIAKGNEPDHILDKFKTPYEFNNGQRLYSLDDPIYAKFVYWLKRYRDNPLTYN